MPLCFKFLISQKENTSIFQVIFDIFKILRKFDESYWSPFLFDILLGFEDIFILVFFCRFMENGEWTKCKNFLFSILMNFRSTSIAKIWKSCISRLIRPTLNLVGVQSITGYKILYWWLSWLVQSVSNFRYVHAITNP